VGESGKFRGRLVQGQKLGRGDGDELNPKKSGGDVLEFDAYTNDPKKSA